MNETAAESLARCLALLGSESIMVVMQEPSTARNNHENHERNDQGTKGFDEKSLHPKMILHGKVGG